MEIFWVGGWMCGRGGGAERRDDLLAQGVANHLVKIGGCKADCIKELPPKELAHQRNRWLGVAFPLLQNLHDRGPSPSQFLTASQAVVRQTNIITYPLGVLTYVELWPESRGQPRGRHG